MSGFQFSFFGEIQPGHDREHVQTQLARLFDVVPQQLDGLMRGEQEFTRTGIDADTADQYLQAFSHLGAIGRVEADNIKTPENIAPTPKPAARTNSGNDDPHHRCPKCTSLEIAGGECGNCGIIIAKYLNLQAQLQPAVGDGEPHQSFSSNADQPEFRRSAVKWLTVATTGLLVISTADQYLGRLGFDFGLMPYIVANLCLAYGCYLFALSKGYPSWIGMLGLFSFAGLSVLLLLPVRGERATTSIRQLAFSLACITYSVYWANNYWEEQASTTAIVASSGFLSEGRSLFPSAVLDSDDAIYQRERDELLQWVDVSLTTIAKRGFSDKTAVAVADTLAEVLADYQVWQHYQIYQHNLRGAALPAALSKTALSKEADMLVSTLESYIDFRGRLTPVSRTIMSGFFGADPYSESINDVWSELIHYSQKVNSLVMHNSRILIQQNPDSAPPLQLDLRQLKLPTSERINADIGQTTIILRLKPAKTGGRYVTLGFFAVDRKSVWNGPRYVIDYRVIDTNIPNKRLKPPLNAFSDWEAPGTAGR